MTDIIEPDFVLRFREMQAAGRLARQRVSGALLAVGIPLALASLGTNMYLFTRESGLGNQNFNQEPRHAWWPLSLLPPAWTLSLIAVLPTDTAMIRAVGDVGVLILAVAIAFFSYLTHVAATGELHWRGITCDGASKYYCWYGLVACAGWTVCLVFHFVWNLVLSRPKQGAPLPFVSRGYWRLVFSAMRTYHEQHGTKRFAMLFLLGGFPGTCPGFWVERTMPSTNSAEQYFLLPARTTVCGLSARGMGHTASYMHD